MGRLVTTKSINGSIDISNLPAQAYQVLFYDQKGNLKSKARLQKMD